jgi:hypothetical protein
MLSYAGACSATAEGTQWLLRATASPVSLQAPADAACEPKLRTCMHAQLIHTSNSSQNQWGSRSHNNTVTSEFTRNASQIDFVHGCGTGRGGGRGWMQRTRLKVRSYRRHPLQLAACYPARPHRCIKARVLGTQAMHTLMMQEAACT